jgi:hypothetical protein
MSKLPSDMDEPPRLQDRRLSARRRQIVDLG